MKILILCDHYPVCSGRYVYDALKRIGHDVKSEGRDMGRNIWGLRLPTEYEWRPNFDDDQRGYEVEWMPELVIVMDSNPTVLDDSKGWTSECPVVTYGVDNHVRDYRRPWIDHYFLAHKAVSIQPFDDKTTWLPCASDPMFSASPIPWNERKYDVCCLGVMYPRRLELVKALQDAGLSVLWGTGLVYEAYRDAYWNSRISLCVSANGDLGQRVFETARMGCAIVTDRVPDLKWVAKMPYGEYSSDDEVVRTVKQCLVELENNPPISEQSAEWALNQTWDTRAAEIVKHYEAVLV